TTTLRAYTAWVSEADQRAAKNIGGRMPERPAPLDGLNAQRPTRGGLLARLRGFDRRGGVTEGVGTSLTA
ncbi:MAG: hypothetical protein LC808_33790, partial [Actinobacteria bacterium]|nr:hypothetical protein [Actinomycetota bacterium]